MGVAALLAPLPLLLVGCQAERGIAARQMPLEYRSAPAAGTRQLQLEGLSSVGSLSTVIGPADLLEVTVVTGLAGDAAEPVRVRVDERGYAETPYVGPVRVAGLEPATAGAAIASAAVQRGIYRRPQVQVVLSEQATNRVTVLGAVTAPGPHEIPRSGCDVLTAIAAAGGFSEEAGTVVEVLRYDTGLAESVADADASPSALEESPGDGLRQVSFDAPPLARGMAPPRTERIDLAELAMRPPQQQLLSDRDVLVVRPKEKRFVHVSGLVHQPNQFELSDDHDVRVLDAVAMAGGITTPVADKVIVIRNVQGQTEPVVARVSLSRAKRDGSENLILQAGDLVSVEPTVATTVVDTFNTLFRVTMGVGGNVSVF